MPIRTCVDCGDQKELKAVVRSLRCKSCATTAAISGKMLKHRSPDKYRVVNDENGKQIYYHRLVMEKHLGRKLNKQEHVHHIDGNKHNNDISNLELMDGKEHHRMHLKERNARTGQHIRAANIRWGNE